MLIAGLLVYLTTGPLLAQSTIDSTRSHAYAANTGWLDLHPSAEHGVVVTETFLSGWAYSGNLGWIHFGDGTPDNGWSYSQGSATDYGVNHDGTGALSGYAWCPNAGWIEFSQAYVDLSFGGITGYAYGGNIGWIALEGPHVQLTTLAIAAPDSDLDSIADPWEWRHFGGLGTADWTTDTDADGLSDLDEYFQDTDPNDFFDQLRITEVVTTPSGDASQVRWTSKPTRNYLIQRSDDLSSWADSGWGEVSGQSFNQISVFGHATSRRFFRVLAVMPLAGFLNNNF